MAPTTRSKAATKAKPKAKAAPSSKPRPAPTPANNKSKKMKSKPTPAAPTNAASSSKVQKKSTKSAARRRKNLRKGLNNYHFEYEEAYKAFPNLFRANRLFSLPDGKAEAAEGNRRRSLYMDSALTTPMPRSAATTPSPSPMPRTFARQEDITPSIGTVRPGSSTASSATLTAGPAQSAVDGLASDVRTLGFRSPGVRFATPSVPRTTITAPQRPISSTRSIRSSASAMPGADPDSRRSGAATTITSHHPRTTMTAPRARRVSSVIRDIASQAAAPPAPWQRASAVAENPRIAALRHETTLSASDFVDIGNALRDIQADVDDLIEIVRRKVNVMEVMDRSRVRRRENAGRGS